jgi:ATP-dependent Clp protease ATP-binding subunit ClpA
LTSEHLFVAVAHVDWSLFRDVLRDVGVNPNAVLAAVEEQLRLMPSGGGELRASPTAKLVCRLAVQQAIRAGRQAIEPTDLFLALFDERRGVTAAIFRRQGIDPDVVIARLQARARELELRLDSGDRARLSSVA